MPDPLGRPAVSADARAIELVRQASWRAAYGHLLPASAFDDWDVDGFSAHRARSIGAGRDWLVVDTPALDSSARSGGDRPSLAAFVSFGPSRDDDRPGVAEIYALYAHPDSFSTGCGRALMRATLDRLRPDYTEVDLWVLADNPRGRAFYTRAGFQPDGTVKDAELPGGILAPELRLSRRLDDL